MILTGLKLILHGDEPAVFMGSSSRDYSIAKIIAWAANNRWVSFNCEAELKPEPQGFF